MREAVEIVRALLNGGTVTYAGRHFTYSEARLALRSVQAHIPIYFAAMGPLTLRLAGRLADGVLLNVGASTEYVRWAVQQVRAGVAAAGRRPEDVTIAAWHSVYVGDGDASGLRRAREWLATVLSIPRQGELLLEGANLDTSILEDIRARVGAYPHRGDPAAAAEFVPPAVAERLTIIGTVPTVRQRLQEYRSAGVDLPILGPRALRAVFGG
jgi:5,10-methylenetetrahydromethanopterin reductase